MSFNFSSWSIKKPVPSLMLFAALTVAGLVGFKGLYVQDFPDIDLPTVTVNVTLPGGTPSQMETEVTRKVEDAVASLGKVEHIRSTVTDGSSATSIEFSLEKNTQEAVDEVRDAVTRIRSQMPNDVNDPIISKVNIGGRALVTYAVESTRMSPAEVSWFVDNTVTKAMLAVKDVANVTRQGGVDREVHVDLDPVKLKSYGVSAAQVSQQLKASQQEAPAGNTELGGVSQSVRAVALAENALAMQSIRITVADGTSVRLSELAAVSDTHGRVSQTAYVDGKEVVSFQVFRSRGAGDVAVASEVRKALGALATANPEVTMTEVSNNVDRIQKSYDGSMHSLYEGAALAIIVVWLFLRDWRATVVSAVALPLSIIPTFLVMNWMGFSLNTVTLLAITLVVGILVDDAIVEVENIERHLRMGKTPIQAAIDAAQEIGLAVVATTMSLVAVFLPTAFMGGVPGKFFKQFGWTAAIAVLASLLVARLLTPMMAAYFLKAHPEPKAEGRVMRGYLRSMQWCLANPAKTLGAAALFFGLSVGLISRIPTEFMPASDNGQVTLNVEMAPGTVLSSTARVAEAARLRIKDLPEIQSIYTAIGTGRSGGTANGGGSAEARTAVLTIALKSEDERKRSQSQVEADIRGRIADIPGARFSLGFGGSGEKYSVTLAGDDASTLVAAAAAVEADLRTLPGLGNVTSSASLLRPEVVIQPDWGKAAEAGVTVQAISNAVRVATAGDNDTSLAKLNLPERQLPIRVQVQDEVRQDLDVLRQLKVPAPGGAIELSNIANVQLGSGPAQINRLDRQRNVTISVDLNGARLGEVSKAASALPSLSKLPGGVNVLPSGDLERMQELFGSFGLAMAAGVLCVYMVLVLLFHSFGQPFTIMAALPLAVGGAFGMLALCGYSMSMPVLIGLLMLMGIVTKNSILLVEYAIVAQRDHGMTRKDALVDACAKRAQPIIMTTIAMAAGMLPIALGMNGDAAFRSPMATAVIGGLMTSTLLSLLVVPVVYERVDNLTARLQRLTGSKPTPA